MKHTRYVLILTEIWKSVIFSELSCDQLVVLCKKKKNKEQIASMYSNHITVIYYIGNNI